MLINSAVYINLW